MNKFTYSFVNCLPHRAQHFDDIKKYLSFFKILKLIELPFKKNVFQQSSQIQNNSMYTHTV